MAVPTTARTSAKERVVAAALALFARHGVGGTSLQMIADEIGVTKAAVYHQYPTKDQIVLAAAESELAHLRAVVDAAAAKPTPELAREALVAGIVDLAVERRRTASTILGDPVIAGFFTEHKPFRELMHRLRALLIGEDSGAEARVELAMLVAVVSGAVMHPFVQDLPDDVLRAKLLRLARRFLGLPA